MIKFSDLIKIKREELDIKLSNLEAMTGITASYISRIEKGQIKGVSGENVFKLAQALNISMSEIAQSFSVELKDTKREDIMDSLNNQLDYILVKRIIDCTLDIANNNKDYYEALGTIIPMLSKLKKSEVTIIGITSDSNADYAITINNNNKYIVEFVKNKLKSNLGAKVIVVEGRYIYGDNDVNHYDLRDFIDDFIDDECEKEEFIKYVKENRY